MKLTFSIAVSNVPTLLLRRRSAASRIGEVRSEAHATVHDETAKRRHETIVVAVCIESAPDEQCLEGRQLGEPGSNFSLAIVVAGLGRLAISQGTQNGFDDGVFALLLLLSTRRAQHFVALREKR